MFGIHEKIRNDEIYLEKYKFLHAQIYFRYRLLQKSNDSGNIIHRLNQYRDSLEENFFQLSVKKNQNQGSSDELGKTFPEEEDDQDDISIEHIYPHILLFLINCAISCLIFVIEVIYFFVRQIYIN